MDVRWKPLNQWWLEAQGFSEFVSACTCSKPRMSTTWNVCLDEAWHSYWSMESMGLLKAQNQFALGGACHSRIVCRCLHSFFSFVDVLGASVCLYNLDQCISDFQWPFDITQGKSWDPWCMITCNAGIYLTNQCLSPFEVKRKKWKMWKGHVSCEPQPFASHSKSTKADHTLYSKCVTSTSESATKTPRPTRKTKWP